MPEPVIKKGSDHFFNITYEGNGTGQRVGKFLPFTDNGTIAKSVIFNDDDNAYLSRTNDAGDRDTFTVSVWVKRSITGNVQQIFDTYDGSSTNDGYIRFNADNTISTRIGSPSNHLYTTNRTFEDTTKWYHIVLSVNTNESTADDRVKLYIDGDLITSYSSRTNPGGGDNTQFNYSSATFRVGSTTGGSYDYDGYVAEFNLVDGSALTPSTFGLTDTTTGRWIPKTLTGITYGTNGHRLEFANSAGQTIGDDTSGNTNDFTVSGLATTDIVTDSPTQNFATGYHDQSDNGTITRSEGNLRAAQGSSTSKMSTMRSTLTLDPNDPNLYYCEGKVITEQGGNGVTFGISDVRADGVRMNSSTLRFGVGTNYMFACDTYVVIEQNGADAGTGNDSTRNPEFTDGDFIGIAFQAGKVWIAKNNTWSNSGNPANGTGYLVDLPKDTLYRFVSGQYGPSGGCISEFNFGQKSFNYTPPTGAKNLQQDNLPAADKDFADFVWIKNRDSTDAHAFYDSSRGPQKEWENSESNEATVTDGLQKFLNGGFAIEDNVAVNTVGESFVAWCWHANGGTTAANTDGSGATVATTVQANDTAGFSICQFQGTGSTLKFAHGLSATPEWFITKRLDAGAGAATSVYHVSNGINEYLHLNESDAVVDSGAATSQFTGVSSTNITLGSNSNSNNNGSDVVAYVWRSVAGFSKFGSYSGNGSANGPYVHLGFKPSWIMFKETGNSNNWAIWDNKRFPFNPTNNSLFADLTQADNSSSIDLDVLSNGFKCRTTNSQINRSGGAYVFMAFAEHPFLGNGTNPVTAR